MSKNRLFFCLLLFVQHSFIFRVFFFHLDEKKERKMKTKIFMFVHFLVCFQMEKKQPQGKIDMCRFIYLCEKKKRKNGCCKKIRNALCCFQSSTMTFGKWSAFCYSDPHNVCEVQEAQGKFLDG